MSFSVPALHAVDLKCPVFVSPDNSSVLTFDGGDFSAVDLDANATTVTVGSSREEGRDLGFDFERGEDEKSEIVCFVAAYRDCLYGENSL